MRNTFIGANRAAWKQTANRLTAKRNRWWEKRQRCRAFLIEHQKSQLRDVNKHMCTVHTYINHIRDVMDVIFCHNCICCGQVQQIVIPGFCAFQLILGILGLSLERRDGTQHIWAKSSLKKKKKKKKWEGSSVCLSSCRFGTTRLEMKGKVWGSREDASRHKCVKWGRQACMHVASFPVSQLLRLLRIGCGCRASETN